MTLPEMKTDPVGKDMNYLYWNKREYRPGPNQYFIAQDCPDLKQFNNNAAMEYAIVVRIFVVVVIW